MGSEQEEECNMGLGLALGVGEYVPRRERQRDSISKPVVCLDLSFTLCPKEGGVNVDCKANRGSKNLKMIEEDHGDYHFGNIKCDSSCNGDEDDSNNNNKKNNCRKKLRLSKEQSCLLENSFKLHSTLNPTQKQALAEQLNLKPRQVEVWFQNRRARTKLKQTEVDCEVLKKYCESLSDENRRLKKELAELRSVKAGPSPLYIQLPKAAALTMCPSCEKIVRTSEGKNAAVFDVGRKEQ